MKSKSTYVTPHLYSNNAGTEGDGIVSSRCGGPELSLQLPNEGKHSLDICSALVSAL